jgi:glycerol-3-phosphate dehydrogenase
VETEVLVVGGGVTGAGVAWDLSLRGMDVALVEMGDVGTGTSERYHGLLHTGSRYAASDLSSARECVQEHNAIRRVVPHVLDDTGGLFVISPADDESFVEEWTAGCEAAGIPLREVGVSEVLKREPLLHKGIRRAFEVPDAACDPFALYRTLRGSAESEGARLLTYHRIEDFHSEDGRVTGARALDLRTGEGLDIRCSMVVNAAGPWVGGVGKLAGVGFEMVLSRGAMLAFNGWWTDTIVSRLRPPATATSSFPSATRASPGPPPCRPTTLGTPGSRTGSGSASSPRPRPSCPASARAASCGAGPG